MSSVVNHDSFMLAFPAAIYDSRRSRRHSTVVEVAGRVASTDSRTKRTSIMTINYEKATPPSSPGAVQLPPEVLARMNSISTNSLKTSFKLVHEPTRMELLSYINILVPWTVTLSFLYMLVAIVPLGISSLFSLKRAKEAVLSINNRLFEVHASKMRLHRVKGTSDAALMALLSPFVAIVVWLLGMLAAVSWAYSVLLSEHDDQITCLSLALSLWRNWLINFCDESTPLDEIV